MQAKYCDKRKTGNPCTPPLCPIPRSEAPETRGWLLEVMKCVESLGKRDFTLDEVYNFERHLAELYPGNQNVRPKIRQQLQYLRDRGFIEFVSRRQYRFRT